MNTNCCTISHGDISAKPDVARFDARRCHRRQPGESIRQAPPLPMNIPYVDPSHFQWRRPAHLHELFSRTDPTVYALGYMETNGGAYKLFDQMADLIAPRARLAGRSGDVAGWSI
jgi:hypothetical protein